MVSEMTIACPFCREMAVTERFVAGGYIRVTHLSAKDCKSKSFVDDRIIGYSDCNGCGESGASIMMFLKNNMKKTDNAAYIERLKKRDLPLMVEHSNRRGMDGYGEG
jgi:hypothetical protein